MDTESHELRVLEVIQETADAVSIVLESPSDANGRFDYKPGQFLTVAVPSDLTGVAARCYSLSSSPVLGEPLKISVKRTAEGYASNWLCDNLIAGDTLRVLPPSGIFTPTSLNADFLLFAGGSGVTPIFSIARSALAGGSGRIVVFYANRDQDSVIFGKQWAELAAANPDRLSVVHWLESVQGIPTQDQLKAFAAQYLSYDAFVCGPAPFMKAATTALRELEFPRERRRQEKFVSLGGNPFGDIAEVAAAESEIEAADVDEADIPEGAPGPVYLEVELDGVQYVYEDWQPGTPLLDHLEANGVAAPFSCRLGECSACACRLLEGELKMLNNDVLDDEDLADGIRLACQAVPVTDRVRVTYS